jgi:ribosomal protein S18 acetylase RimI-like enzyme
LFAAHELRILRRLRMTYAVRPLAAEELSGPLLDQALAVFAGALDFPKRHARVTSFAGTISRHATYGGFRAFGAFNTDRKLVGFSYGYTSVPGRWWRETIAHPLTEEQRDYWLADAFELAELHVHPTAQGLKLGSQLHDLVMHGLPHQTGLLSVMHRSERARHLYKRRGWQTLVAELRFPTEPRTPFSLLGLALSGQWSVVGGQ